MRKYSFLVFVMMIFLTVSTTSCSKKNNTIGGEGAEGTEQGGGGELGNETGRLWAYNATADEIVNGIRLILSYDAATSSFKGTLENLNTGVAPQVKVEVHVFDAANVSTEFGPTAPADMQPGEKRPVTLAITPGMQFVKFNMHPEVGGSGGQ